MKFRIFTTLMVLNRVFGQDQQQPVIATPNATLSQGLTYKCLPFKPNGHQNYIQKDGCPRDIYTTNNPDLFTIEFIYNSSILGRLASRAAVTIRSNQQELVPLFTASGMFGNLTNGVQLCQVEIDLQKFNSTVLGNVYETITQVRIAVTENFNDTVVVRTAVGVSFVVRQEQFKGNNTGGNPPTPGINIPPTGDNGSSWKSGLVFSCTVFISMAFLII